MGEYHFNELHIGLESGLDEVLKILNKGYDKNDEIKSLTMLKNANIDYNALIMMGAGGKEYSKEHVNETVKLINGFKPKMLALMSTTIDEKSDLGVMVKEGVFSPLTEKEMIDEELSILKSVQMDEDAYFFGNHYYNTIPATGYFKHKDFIIEYIEDERNRLMNEKEIMMNSTFNTYPKKRGGILFI